MDGLDIVTLLDRQRRAQQQLGHAQYAVHGRTDLVAELGQKFGLGVDFGGAGRQLPAGAVAILTDTAQALCEGDVEDHSADQGKTEQGEDQPLRGGPGQTQQCRQDHQAADVADQQTQAEGACRAIALQPMPGADHQHGHAGQRQQAIGEEVEWQAVDEQQQEPTQGDQGDLGLEDGIGALMSAP